MTNRILLLENDLKVRNLAALAKEIEKRGVLMKPSITGDLDSDLKNLRVPSPGQVNILLHFCSRKFSGNYALLRQR